MFLKALGPASVNAMFHIKWEVDAMPVLCGDVSTIDLITLEGTAHTLCFARRWVESQHHKAKWYC